MVVVPRTEAYGQPIARPVRRRRHAVSEEVRVRSDADEEVSGLSGGRREVLEAVADAGHLRVELSNPAVVVRRDKLLAGTVARQVSRNVRAEEYVKRAGS